MNAHDFLIVFLGLISEIIGTVSGFGSSTYFVPMASFFEKFTFVITLTAILHSFSNFFKIYLFRQYFKKDLFIKMAIPSVLFCLIGATLTSESRLDLIKLILGLFMMLFSILSYINLSSPKKLGSKTILLLSSVSGFLTGFIGTGGALRGLALSALNISKESFVFLSSSIDVGGDLIRLIVYLKKGYMEWDQWFYIPFLFIAASIGTQLGKKILKRVPQILFEKVVLVLTFGSGSLLVINSIKSLAH